MEILKILKTLEQPSLDLVAEKMGSEFADAVSNAMTLLVSQGERIAELEEQHRWIPVTERLPEDIYPVLVSCGKGYRSFIARYDIIWKEWRVSHTLNITHWMPLPQSPHEESL